MEKLITTGRYFFSIGIIGLGIEHFILQDFIMDGHQPGRIQYPASRYGPIYPE